MAQAYRMIAALAIWSGVVLQFVLSTQGRHGMALATAILNYFSYFTILSNLLCALCLTVPWLAPRARAGVVLSGSPVRTAATLYILVTALVYKVILAPLSHPEGLHWTANALLHYAAPILFMVDWLVFTPHGRLSVRSLWAWLAFPLVFSGWTWLHGGLSGFYPYGFLDVSRLGAARTLLNIAGLAVLFTVAGAGLIGIDRALARLPKASTPN